ncbi:MAG: hypothetical protein JWN08_12 [Frankiales bacterium]|nr:hypothetical protein [Frankiales bacterium]
MIVVGVVLLVLSALLTAGIALFNGGEVTDAEVFGVSLSNVSLGGLFVAGVITGVVGALGLGLMLTGSARKRHKKTAVKRQVRSARTEAETLAEQNARLQEQLEQERHTTVRPVGDEPYRDETSGGGVRDDGVRGDGVRDDGVRDGGLRDDGVRDGGVRDDGVRDGGPTDDGGRHGRR